MPTKKELLANAPKFYAPLPENLRRTEDGEVLDEHLKIDLSFDSSGSNLFSYQRQSRGMFVHFTVVERERGFERTRIPDNRGFKICAVPTERFTAKPWQALVAFVTENITTLQELYFAGQTERLQAFLRTGELPPIAEEPAELPRAA